LHDTPSVPVQGVEEFFTLTALEGGAAGLGAVLIVCMEIETSAWEPKHLLLDQRLIRMHAGCILHELLGKK